MAVNAPSGLPVLCCNSMTRLLPEGVENMTMALKRWTLILFLAALPLFAGSEPPFNPGDVVSTASGPFGCGPHAFAAGFGAALYRHGSTWPSRFSDADFRFPVPSGPVTYSPALNRMVMPAVGGTFTTLETLDADGHITPLLTLPEQARVTALAGIGREILAVVALVAPSYRFELWRIAGDGSVTEQIGLPLSPPPLPIRDIASIDLAADRCTLAYVVPGEVVHRYDICARRPLADATTRTASAVHFLPRGILLVSDSPGPTVPLPSRLTRYDREGRPVSTADPVLLPGEMITAIALDPDGSTAWLVTSAVSPGCVVAGRLLAVDASTGALIAGPWPFGGQGVAVAGEWRAAEQPPGRGRAIR